MEGLPPPASEPGNTVDSAPRFPGAGPGNLKVDPTAPGPQRGSLPSRSRWGDIQEKGDELTWQGFSRVRLTHGPPEVLTPGISPNAGNAAASFVVVGDCVRALRRGKKCGQPWDVAGRPRGQHRMCPVVRAGEGSSRGTGRCGGVWAPAARWERGCMTQKAGEPMGLQHPEGV